MSGFDDIERAMQRAAEKAYNDLADERRRMFDRLGQELKGQSLDVAKSRLQGEWASGGGSLTDPHVTAYAEALVSAGGVDVQAEPIKW